MLLASRNGEVYLTGVAVDEGKVQLNSQPSPGTLQALAVQLPVWTGW